MIEPTASGRKWTARLGDRVLCVSAWPFVNSARLLLDEGYPPNAVLEMWRPNATDWALRGRLGAVAATVMDGETASRCAKNGSPARDPKRGSRKDCRWFALVLGPFLGWTMTLSIEAIDHALAVYDGQYRVGSVVERHGKFLTYDIDDLNVGVFATLRDAMRCACFPPHKNR